MELAFAAPFGLMIGSFLNVVAYRLPRGESLVAPASHCPGCETPIRPWDNIPLLSWVFLRGRCRSCGVRISPRYPLVELLTGVLFAVVAAVHGLHAELAVELPFVAMLIAVADIDLEHRVVPNKILLAVAVWGVAGSAVVRQSSAAGREAAARRRMGGAQGRAICYSAPEHDWAAVARLIARSTSAGADHERVALAQQQGRRVRHAQHRHAHGAIARGKSLLAGHQLVHLYIHHFL